MVRNTHEHTAECLGNATDVGRSGYGSYETYVTPDTSKVGRGVREVESLYYTDGAPVLSVLVGKLNGLYGDVSNATDWVSLHTVVYSNEDSLSDLSVMAPRTDKHHPLKCPKECIGIMLY